MWLKGEYMATVNVEVNVQSPGLSSAQKQAEQLHNSLKGAAAAAAAIRVPTPVRTAQAAMPGAGSTATDTNLSRGVAGVSGASGRDFAKQAQGLGGLVHVYATFAANLFAVSAAFGALSRAADTTNIIKGLDQLGAVSGRSLGGLAKQMVSAADGAISLRTAMSSTAMSTAAGMSSANILRMTEVAKKASLALGRDMPDSMDRLTKGIAKVQPELLDELGIMARVIPSQEAYARQLGKSVSALTDFEKKQAFANAVLEEGERKFGNIQIDANPYSKLLASMTNVAQTGLELVNKVLTPILNVLSSNPTALAAVMAGLGGILLKQAIPALGQFKKSLEDAAIFANKKAQEAFLNQQLSSGVLDDITEKSIKRKVRLQENYYTKLATLESNGSKFSTSTLTALGTGLTTNLKNTTDDQLKIWAARANAIQGTNTVEAGLIRNQIAGVLDLRRINKIASDEGDAISARRIKSAEGVFSQESSLRRLSQEADRSASKIYIADQARRMQATEGFFAAIKNGYQNINLAVTSGTQINTGGLTAAGDAATRLGGKLSVVAGGIALIGVTTRAAVASVGTAFASFLPWLEIIGLAILGLVTLSSYLSNNSKETEKLSKSQELLTGSLDTVDAVIKNLASNKDPLDYLSTAATEAKANALKGLSDSLKQVFLDTKIAIDAMGRFDRGIDNVKSGLFGKGIRDEGANNLASSISKAFQLVATGPERDKAAKQVKDLLKMDIDPSSVDALKRAINAGNFLEMGPKIQAIIDKLNIGIAEIASNAKSLDDSFATAAKSYDTVVSSLMPTDTIAKLGFDLVKVALDFDKALQDPKTAIDQIAKSSKDITRLKLMDPVDAEVLLRSSKNINDMASSYANLTSWIDKATIKRAELLSFMKQEGESEKLRGQVNELTARITLKLEAKKDIEAKLEPIMKLFTNQQYAAMEKGANYVRASIGEGFEKASISVSKALSDAQSGTIGGIRESARLDKQALDVQQRVIDVNNSLIIATDNLTRVQEDIAIQGLKSEAAKLPAGSPELKGLLATIRNRQAIQKLDFSDKTLAQLSNIFKTGTPDEKAAAKQALSTVQALESNKGKIVELAASKRVIDIKARYAEMDVETNNKKDQLAVALLALGIDKTRFDLLAKSAPYLDSQLLTKQIINEKSAIDNKLEQDKLEYNNKIAKLVIDRAETTKRTDISETVRLKSLANIKKSIEETSLANTRRLEKANAEAAIKAIADQERKNKAEKDASEFTQKMLDIKNATSNIYLNTNMTISEEELNLRKQIGSESEHVLITQMADLALRKENQRTLEATQTTTSAKNFENIDFEKKLADMQAANNGILDKTSTTYKNILENHTQIITKLQTTISAEQQLHVARLGNLDTLKKYNIALNIQKQIEDKLAKESTISADKLEVAQAQLGLDGQRLDNMKELNRIIETQYIKDKAGLEVTRQQLEYTQKIKSANDAVNSAKARLTLADQNSTATKGTESQDQTNAKSAVELAESARSKIEAIYRIEQKRTAEQLQHNLLLLEQKRILDQISSLTSSLEVIFDDLGKSIGDSVEAIYKFGKNYDDAQKAIEKARESNDPKELALANKAQTMGAISDLALVAKATKGVFDKETLGYKVLTAAEKAFSAMKIADTVKEFALKSGLLGMWQAASATANALLVAEAGITGTAAATASIPAVMMKFMAQMGPWGWAAAAAAIAALGLGVQGDSMVDMTGKTAAERQTSQGTGTVTGDSTAKSQSITNSLDILNATSVEGLSYDSEMVNLLTSINSGISGVAKGVYGVVGLTSGTAFNTREGQQGGSINILGGLFGSTSSKQITDTGLALKGTFGDFINGSSGFVSAYEDVLTTSTSSFLWFSSTSQSLTRQAEALDPKVSASISKVFKNAAKVFVEAGTGLGMTAESVMTQLLDIDLSKTISLRGLHGQELETAISSVFSSLLDNAANTIFQELQQFNRMGEGILETAVRVGDGLTKVNLGMQSIGKATVGSGISGVSISEWLISAAGGLDKFLDKTKNFNTKFITETERLVPVQAAVNKEFARLGVTGTLTRDGFKKLVQGFKIVGPATAKAYDDLLDLADSVDQLTKSAEDSTKALNSARLDQSIKIFELLGESETALRLSRQKELDALDELLRPGQMYINALEDEKTLKAKLTTAYNTESAAIKSTITSLKASIKTLTDYKTALTIGSMTILDPTQVYQQTKDSFNKLKDIIKAPAVTDAEKLAQADAISKFAAVSDQFLTASRVVNASDATYVTDFKSVTDFVDTSSVLLATQQTAAEQQLQYLETSVASLDLIKTATETTAELLLQLIDAQAKTQTAKTGYDQSLTTAAASSATTKTELAISDNLAVQGAKIVRDDMIAKEIELYYQKTQAAKLVSNKAIEKPVVTNYMLQYESPGGAASGGIRSGLTLVGEQGPEIVDFKTPSRVYSNPASNDLLSNADLIAEIRNLHKEIAQLRKDQREQTGYLIKSNYDANQLAAQQVADATEAATATNAWNMRSAVKIA